MSKRRSRVSLIHRCCSASNKFQYAASCAASKRMVPGIRLMSQASASWSRTADASSDSSRRTHCRVSPLRFLTLCGTCRNFRRSGLGRWYPHQGKRPLQPGIRRSICWRIHSKESCRDGLGDSERSAYKTPSVCSRSQTEIGCSVQTCIFVTEGLSAAQAEPARPASAAAGLRRLLEASGTWRRQR